MASPNSRVWLNNGPAKLLIVEFKAPRPEIVHVIGSGLQNMWRLEGTIVLMPTDDVTLAKAQIELADSVYIVDRDSTAQIEYANSLKKNIHHHWIAVREWPQPQSS
jgi:hypothetical protein